MNGVIMRHILTKSALVLAIAAVALGTSACPGREGRDDSSTTKRGIYLGKSDTSLSSEQLGGFEAVLGCRVIIDLACQGGLKYAAEFLPLSPSSLPFFLVWLCWLQLPLPSNRVKVPGQALGINSDADLWRFVRTGNAGSVSMKDELGAVMIQSEGDNWRALRNGPISNIDAFAMFIMLFVLTMFYMIGGKIRIEKGPSGKTILRFGSIDRFAHWLMAGSFVVLGLTGLNMLYGRYVLLPVIGPEAFSAITAGGKYAHNYLAFAALMSVWSIKHSVGAS